MTAPTPREILAAVSAESGFTPCLLRGRSTVRGLAAARKIAMLLMHDRGRLTWGRIGEVMDRRTPGVVERAVDRAAVRLAHEAALRDLLRRAEARLPAAPFAAPAPPPEDPRKLARPRKCLMCAKGFQSSGAHERICHTCKATSTWKAGNHFAVYPK